MKCTRRWTNNWPHTLTSTCTNRGGVQPSGIEEMTRAARALKHEAVVWRGDPLLPVTQQGVKVLGIPIGKQEYAQEFLAHKSRQQQVLFQRIPWVNDTQSAFLLLSMCGATRANFWLRAVRPEDTEDFARQHNENVWACLREILGTTCVSGSACVVHRVIVSGAVWDWSVQFVFEPLHIGPAGQIPCEWSQRNLRTARLMIRQLEDDDPVSCFIAVNQCEG